ncbi:predicted protein [Sclerotinia sclerotiorum 1980 UF-70]|uniref:Uncharacterized protein n=1 Tax=Sclerotinia sclerotiorum (strain ATCC 18683 / 1980 / Ss-1) TaxID=665079 RepID=A7EYN3_SCLS1|nr:predicted protein [Sclerotinia sclerotiorum 1980 UF-70]EDN94575.1 predicted protein [Sclerotinia sclerotiorum 1980 UF-70]
MSESIFRKMERPPLYLIAVSHLILLLIHKWTDPDEESAKSLLDCHIWSSIMLCYYIFRRLEWPAEPSSVGPLPQAPVEKANG